MRILIVEDDPTVADALAKTFERQGLQPEVVGDGDRASELLQREEYALILLDIGLPGTDGLTLLKQIRAASPSLPVMLLTARDAIGDRIGGLDLGADDYLVKPFSTDEVAARARALLRRANLRASTDLTHGPLHIDTVTHRVTLDGQPLELTEREWEVLTFLVRRPEQVIAKESLQVAAGGGAGAGYNAAEVYISRLRAKIEPSGLRIRTVRGFGYMLEDYKPQAAEAVTAEPAVGAS
jgi:DNA-binding response OmpR family regulator